MLNTRRCLFVIAFCHILVRYLCVCCACVCVFVYVLVCVWLCVCVCCVCACVCMCVYTYIPDTFLRTYSARETDMKVSRVDAEELKRLQEQNARKEAEEKRQREEKAKQWKERIKQAEIEEVGSHHNPVGQRVDVLTHTVETKGSVIFGSTLGGEDQEQVRQWEGHRL